MASESSFQRLGTPHNAGVGRSFESAASAFLYQNIGVKLVANFSVEVGVSGKKKLHKFDLGSDDPAILVECKSHTWTQGNAMPSAKMSVWNEAMYYFHIAPPHFRKILFVLKHDRRGLSLASYYLRTYRHMIPDGVEIWEFDEATSTGQRLI